MARLPLCRLAFAAGLAALAAGCALREPPKPDELRSQSLPNAKLPAAWVAAPATAEVANGWLTEFHDAALERVVAEAIAYNPDLQVAAARVEAAEAAARAAGASLWPQLNAAGRGGGKLSGDGSGLQGIGLFARLFEKAIR